MSQDRNLTVTTQANGSPPRQSRTRWPRAVVFDCDGLLLDTSPCWRSAYEHTLARHGRALSTAQLKALNGASLRAAAKLLNVPETELGAALRASVAASPPQLLPGVTSMLQRLQGTVPLAVATNGPAILVTQALAQAGIGSFFETIVSAETLRDKPAPDVYLAAIRALRVRPIDAIAFEDSPRGVAAARNAGLTVVYIPSNKRATAKADLRVSRLDDPQVLSLFGPTEEAVRFDRVSD